MGFIAAAFVFAGWRNLPRIDQPQSSAAGLLLGGAVLLAFWLGRGSVRAEAVATAVAQARAQAAASAHAGAQSVAGVIVNVGEGARQVAADQFGQPEWVGARQVVVSEQIEGSDAVMSALEDVLSARQEAVEADSG